jgi:hypothetical protein
MKLEIIDKNSYFQVQGVNMNKGLRLVLLGAMAGASLKTAGATNTLGGVVLDCYGVEGDSLKVLQVVQDVSGKYLYSAQSCSPLSPDGTPANNAVCESDNGEIFKTGAGSIFGFEGDAFIHPESSQTLRFEDPSKNLSMNFWDHSCKPSTFAATRAITVLSCENQLGNDDNTIQVTQDAQGLYHYVASTCTTTPVFNGVHGCATGEKTTCVASSGEIEKSAQENTNDGLHFHTPGVDLDVYNTCGGPRIDFNDQNKGLEIGMHFSDCKTQ